MPSLDDRMRDRRLLAEAAADRLAADRRRRTREAIEGIKAEVAMLPDAATLTFGDNEDAVARLERVWSALRSLNTEAWS